MYDRANNSLFSSYIKPFKNLSFWGSYIFNAAATASCFSISEYTFAKKSFVITTASSSKQTIYSPVHISNALFLPFEIPKFSLE